MSKIDLGDIVYSVDRKKVGIVLNTGYISLTMIISCVWDENTDCDGWAWGPEGKFKLIEKGDYKEQDLSNPEIKEKLKNMNSVLDMVHP